MKPVIYVSYEIEKGIKNNGVYDTLKEFVELKELIDKKGYKILESYMMVIEEDENPFGINDTILARTEC